jgi:hypothetical protein
VSRTVQEDISALSYAHSSYLCPRCCRSRRPALNQVLTLLVSLKELDLQFREGIALQSLANRAVQWLERVRTTLSKDEVKDLVSRLSSTAGRLQPKQEPGVCDGKTSTTKSSLDNVNLGKLP